jgi:DNA-binding response OmpR family regulator
MAPDVVADTAVAGLPRVLVVEDEDAVGEVIADVLADAGFAVRRARNGREGLSVLGQWLPSVIILDLMMPVMDGWEFRRRQVSDATIAAVPVVVLSALDPGRAGELGGTAFLKKPLDFDHLLELVRRFCAPTG